MSRGKVKVRDNVKYRIFLYKRGTGYVKNFLCPDKTAKDVGKRLLEKYDGVLIIDGNGFMKAMYGYCGG